MTQFINSFLIEPVVRQARRFSRSSDSEASHDEQPLPRQNAGFPQYADALESSLSEHDSATLRLNPSNRSQSRAQATATHDTALGPQAAQSQPGPSLTSDQRRRAGTDPQPQATTAAGRAAAAGDRFRSANASLPTSINEVSLRSTGLAGHLRQSVDRSTMSDANTGSSPRGDGVLPEDDGMGSMRQKIVKIQNMDATPDEKSRLIHTLMTGQYSAAQHLQSPTDTRPRSPSSLRSQDRPTTPNSAQSMPDPSQTGSPLTSRSSITDELYVSANDLKPTYWDPPVRTSAPTTAQASPAETRKNSLDTEEEEAPLGCRHYKRNVKLQCSTCLKWYTCRFCHDEVEDHTLNRRDTRHMLCMYCGCTQPASGECRDCGEPSAWYYCGICKLWDNDTAKSIYHCDDCGICRVGEGLGKDFYHCKTCCVCLAMSIRDTHRCIERSTDCDCPICGEYMFTSPQTVVFMRCGHSIHQSCYREHMQNSFKCPICSRSIINMEMTFRQLDRAIESQPMPPQFQDTKAFVYCNDCCAKSSVMYHWLGLKCAVCDSYNTVQLRMISDAHNTTAPAVTSPADELPPNDVEMVLPEAIQATSRGRTLAVSDQARRTATSASALDFLRPPAFESRLDRATRATSENNMHSIIPGDIFASDSGDSDAMETDDEDDDVDFWGGESPRERAAHRNENSDEDDSEDDSDDDVMTEDDDDEDSGEEDRMELIGHR